ncbi:hypothetical protein LWV33_11820 [Brucella intermedia]
MDLLPLLVRDRPWSAVGIALLLIASAALMITVTLFWWRRFDPIPWKGRMLRLAFALPLLAWFAVISDYASFSLARDRLRILPIMWDQKENYAHNGFTMAFILNVPMATVFAPEGYSPEAIAAIEPPAQLIPAAFDSRKPDVIMVMSEILLGSDAPSRRGLQRRSDPDSACGTVRPCLLAGIRRHDGQCRV